MKKLMALIQNLFALFTAFANPNLKHEVSMGFDLKDVAPFLADLEAKFKFGIKVDKLAKFAASIPVEEEKFIVVKILDSGRKSKMMFHVFMDDVDTPDLYMFFDSSTLSQAVSDFMSTWSEKRYK